MDPIVAAFFCFFFFFFFLFSVCVIHILHYCYLRVRVATRVSWPFVCVCRTKSRNGRRTNSGHPFAKRCFHHYHATSYTKSHASSFRKFGYFYKASSKFTSRLDIKRFRLYRTDAHIISIYLSFELRSITLLARHCFVFFSVWVRIGKTSLDSWEIYMYL